MFYHRFNNTFIDYIEVISRHWSVCIEKNFALGLECTDLAAFFAVVYEWKMYEEQTCKPRMFFIRNTIQMH